MLKSEKGVSAIEFALIAPFLFFLSLGIVEFGVLLFDKAVVTNASREGARAAIVYNTRNEGNNTVYEPISRDDVMDVVTRYTENYHLISLGGPSDPVVTINYRDSEGANIPESGGDVTVSVEYTYDFLVFPNMERLLCEWAECSSDNMFDGTIDLVGTTVMRME